MKASVENCWDNVAEWSFFLVPSDELIVVKNNACAGSGVGGVALPPLDGTICTKFASLQRSCHGRSTTFHQVNLDDDEFIRHGQLRPMLRKACEQWMSSIQAPRQIVVEFK